jgi:hypothetical protein
MSDNTIAIGNNAGQTFQGSNAIAIGTNAGQDNQGPFATAIGSNAGNENQGIGAIAMGLNAGQNDQGPFSIAIGTEVINGGNSSIGIGAYANVRSSNTIVLNGTGTNLASIMDGTLLIAPIRPSGFPISILGYNTVTSEVTSYSAHASDIQTICERLDALEKALKMTTS